MEYFHLAARTFRAKDTSLFCVDASNNKALSLQNSTKNILVLKIQLIHQFTLAAAKYSALWLRN